MSWETIITVAMSAVAQIGAGAYWIGTINARVGQIEKSLQEHTTLPTRVSVLETKFDHIAAALERIESRLAEKE